VPGALHDFDLPDLPALVAPRPALWLDTTDATGRPANADALSERLRWSRAICDAVADHERLATASIEEPDDHRQAAVEIDRFAGAK